MVEFFGTILILLLNWSAAVGILESWLNYVEFGGYRITFP